MSTSPNRQTAELAGGLRTVINRLAFHLRGPATRQGLTPTRLSAVAALQKAGPQRPGDLATRLSISAASMSRLAESLESGGWVRRTPDPADHRACRLTITEHGVVALDSLRGEVTAQLADAIAGLPADQRTALADALPALVVLADRYLDPD